jgi:hypothetical protein
MSTWYRQADRRFPFLHAAPDQPAGRWHGDGEGPVQYLADTPDGAWAELLRHWNITLPEDLGGIDRALWAVEVEEGAEVLMRPRLHRLTMLGSLNSYAACRAAARRLRERGASGLLAPSAALLENAASGQRTTRDGLVEAGARDGRVLVLFGPRSRLRGWCCALRGAPTERLLPLVRHL